VGRTGRQGNVLQDGWMAVSSSIMIGLQGSKWCFIDVAMTTQSKRWRRDLFCRNISRDRNHQ